VQCSLILFVIIFSERHDLWRKIAEKKKKQKNDDLNLVVARGFEFDNVCVDLVGSGEGGLGPRSVDYKDTIAPQLFRGAEPWHLV